MSDFVFSCDHISLRLNIAFEKPKIYKYKIKTQIEAEGIQRAIQWWALIDTNGIESKADLAGYLGVSRARITRVLKKLINYQYCTTKTVDLTSN